MERILQISSTDRFARVISPSARVLFLSLFCLLSLVLLRGETAGQDVDKPRLRVGEKLSYSLSFGKFTGAGNAELFVASRGKLGLTDAIEIRSRVKTVDLVSAAFMLLDENRTVYAAPDTGLPLYVSKISQVGAIPKEIVSNYLTVPTSNFDLITLLYRVREAGGAGTFPFLDNDRLYSAVFTAGPSIRIKTDAGEFETIMSSVQSEFLTANGIRDLRINFATDESRIPVMFRFMTPRGEFKAVLSSFTLPDSDAAPLPTPVPTPVPPATPKPTPRPEVYVENRPLLPELGFALGETLDYRVTNAGVPAGVITLSAVERKKYKEKDSLLLTATVTRVEPGNPTLRLGDSYRAQVDPDSLIPMWAEAKFSSGLPALKQNITFDQAQGKFAFGEAKPADGPVGTHSMVSLIYAIRSFNLKPSRELTNPVNDTRVAVFWETKPYIFYLRPANIEEVTIDGDKISAQLITIKTENPTLDAMGLKVWLSTVGRVPVRFSAGTYVAELVSSSPNARK